MKTPKILVTGGHMTPALAVVDELIHPPKKCDIIWVGRTISLEKERIKSEEQKFVEERHITFIPLTTGRFTRTISIQTIFSLCKIPIGLIQAFTIIWSNSPDIILTFGGYIGLPIAIAGWIFKIPIVAHEQTTVPGIANRIIGKISTSILLTFEQSKKYFSNRAIVVGLPIRKNLFHPPIRPSFLCPKTFPILYIQGGSTGSVSMNTQLMPILPELLFRYTVIHQTGVLDFERLMSFKKTLQPSLADRFIPLPTLNESDLAWVYAHASLYIGRSGANTIAELLIFGLPALFIPLPWASNDEQEKNAEYVKKYGIAEIIKQNNITTETVLRLSKEYISKQEEAKQKPKKSDVYNQSLNSARSIATVVWNIVEGRKEN